MEGPPGTAGVGDKRPRDDAGEDLQAKRLREAQAAVAARPGVPVPQVGAPLAQAHSIPQPASPAPSTQGTTPLHEPTSLLERGSYPWCVREHAPALRLGESCAGKQVGQFWPCPCCAHTTRSITLRSHGRWFDRLNASRSRRSGSCCPRSPSKTPDTKGTLQLGSGHWH